MSAEQLCLRWREGRSRFRPADPIRTAEYDVAPIGETAAKSFVVRHHYSRSYPARREPLERFRNGVRVGLSGILASTALARSRQEFTARQ